MESVKTLLSFSAYLKDEEERTPFSFSVLEPQPEDEYSAYCVVSCPFLLKKETNIYGADKKQAIALSMDFIADMLGERVGALIDEAGNSVSLPNLPSWTDD